MSAAVHLLCAGAVQGLVKELRARFEADTGATLTARFGAVGAMREALLAGESCDVLIVTDAMSAKLRADAVLAPEPATPLGRVRTGIAVRAGEPLPDIATPAALKSALLAASAVYFPDPMRATAGIHFAWVLDRLVIADEIATKQRTYPNGATSMRELAAAAPGAIGCTQITEILYSPGIALVGPLPTEFELATVYSAAVTARAAEPAHARRLVELLAGPASRELRAAGGFEFD